MALMILSAVMIPFQDEIAAQVRAHQSGLLAGCFYVLLAIFLADVLDGVAARMLKATSRFGAMLDPFADKLINILMLVFLGNQAWAKQSVPMWYLSVIIARMLTVTFMRYMVEKTGKAPNARSHGKIVSLLLCHHIATVIGVHAYISWLPNWLVDLHLWLLGFEHYIVAGMAVFSWLLYTREWYPDIRAMLAGKKRRKKRGPLHKGIRFRIRGRSAQVRNHSRP